MQDVLDETQQWQPDPKRRVLELEQWGVRVCTEACVISGDRLLPAWDDFSSESAPHEMLTILREYARGAERGSVAPRFYALFDARNAYPYFMRDVGFNLSSSPIPLEARMAVGAIVGGCQFFDTQEMEEWLEELGSLWIDDLRDPKGLDDMLLELGRASLRNDRWVQQPS